MNNLIPAIVNLLNSEDRGDVLLGQEYFNQQDKVSKMDINTQINNWKWLKNRSNIWYSFHHNFKSSPEQKENDGVAYITLIK